MKIAVWKTGHEIADTVAQSLAEGFDADIRSVEAYNVGENEGTPHLAYGILRGTAAIFKSANHWFNIDRGYFAPGHYDGYYRISYRGTQAKYDPAFPITKEYQGELKPVRNIGEYVLICSPTNHVNAFFNIDSGHNGRWVRWAIAEANKIGTAMIRDKNSPNELLEDLLKAKAVITFNSSVGWQALINGIPCISDPLHSVVGSYYDTISIDSAYEMLKNKSRKPLLDFMASHQFTLAEIRQGLAWPLINHYLSISAGIQEKQSAPTYAHTPSANGLKAHFQSGI